MSSRETDIFFNASSRVGLLLLISILHGGGNVKKMHHPCSRHGSLSSNWHLAGAPRIENAIPSSLLDAALQTKVLIKSTYHFFHEPGESLAVTTAHFYTESLHT